MQERIQKLKEQVAGLLELKRQNSAQQIPFNPPVNTTAIMYENHFIVQPDFQVSGGTGIALEVIKDGRILYMPVIPYQP